MNSSEKPEKDVYLTGFNLILENTKRLFRAAESLENTKEFAVASSLLVLSAEEAIKAMHVFYQYCFPGSELKSFELSFEDHKFKIENIRSLVGFSRMTQAMLDLYYLPVLDSIKSGLAPEELVEVKSRNFKKLLEWFRDEARAKKTDLFIENKWWKSAKVLNINIHSYN